jgi:hypothetical protein
MTTTITDAFDMDTLLRSGRSVREVCTSICTEMLADYARDPRKEAERIVDAAFEHSPEPNRAFQLAMQEAEYRLREFRAMDQMFIPVKGSPERRNFFAAGIIFFVLGGITMLILSLQYTS